MLNENKNSVILSETTRLRDTNQNVLVVGCSGSGKTITYVLPNLYQCNGSCVVVDLIGLIYEKTAKMFEENGYKIKTFDVAKTSAADIEAFDASSLGREPTVVYILIGYNKEANTSVVPPLIHKILKECTSPTELPIHIFLDEFSQIGKIPEFYELLATTSPTVSCSIIFQTIQQLCCLYPETWTEIVANCDATVFLGGSNTNTLAFVSGLIRYAISPQEIERMDRSDCLVLIKGHPNKVDKKYNPFKIIL